MTVQYKATIELNNVLFPLIVASRMIELVSDNESELIDLITKRVQPTKEIIELRYMAGLKEVETYVYGRVVKKWEE